MELFPRHLKPKWPLSAFVTFPHCYIFTEEGGFVNPELVWSQPRDEAKRKFGGLLPIPGQDCDCSTETGERK
eukprot:1160032-Pelagomonas_calceolata.AAC.8